MDIITAIRRERGKYRVTIGDSERFLISCDIMRERPLQEGQEIDLEEYDQWLMIRQYQQALERAVALLATRARSRHELEQKLLLAGYRPCTVEMALYKLQREKLLDDAEFARQWVESRTAGKMGRTRIAQELRRKGVSADEAEDALAEIDDEDQLAAATALAEKAAARIKPGEDPRKAANRILSMLARRGFGWDVARQALRQAMDGLEDEL